MKPFWEWGARGWPECSQRCRGCPFLALSGFRMIHSMAKPLKVFPNPDLEICPTQQLTKTQLKDHSINLPSLCSSLFPSRVFASCWFGIKTSRGQKDKVSLPGLVTAYRVGLTRLSVDFLRRATSSGLLSPSAHTMSSLQGTVIIWQSHVPEWGV